MKPKGMHDIATAETLINRSIPASRAQMVARLARMEHERARLERELNVWLGQQQQTEWRLQQVRQHMELLQRALDRDGGGRQTADDERKAKGLREIPLEY